MRPTNESYKGAAKSSEVCPCIGIGDMPVFVDDGEKTFFHVFQNVRVVPGFGYTLASVQQFEDEGVETIFGANRRIVLANGTHLPFERSADRLYVLQAASAINHAPESAAIALAAVAHKRKAHAHVDRSTADAAARELHARTHMSTSVIKSMIGSTTNAQKNPGLRPGFFQGQM